MLLLNLGGPETLADVQPFLYNLFADDSIIRLPPYGKLPRIWSERTQSPCSFIASSSHMCSKCCAMYWWAWLWCRASIEGMQAEGMQAEAWLDLYSQCCSCTAKMLWLLQVTITAIRSWSGQQAPTFRSVCEAVAQHVPNLMFTC